MLPRTRPYYGSPVTLQGSPGGEQAMFSHSCAPASGCFCPFFPWGPLLKGQVIPCTQLPSPVSERKEDFACLFLPGRDFFSVTLLPPGATFSFLFLHTTMVGQLQGSPDHTSDSFTNVCPTISWARGCMVVIRALGG